MNAEALHMEGWLYCSRFPVFFRSVIGGEIPGYVGLTYNFQKLEKAGCGGIYL